MTGRSFAKAATVVAMTLAAAGCSSGPLAGITDRGMTINAQFDNANGLYAGNAVSILGMKVGTVDKIVPRGRYVEVEMHIDPGVKIPADAQAVTVSTSILTDRHVEFTPVYQGGPLLADRDSLGLARTRTPVEFDRVLAMIDKLAVQLQGDGAGAGPVAEFLNVGAAMTDGNGPRIRSALGELSTALKMSDERGAPTGEAITTIVENLQALTTAAAENDETIREFGSSIRQLSAVIEAEQLGRGSTGARMNEVLSETADLLDTNRENLHSVAANSELVTRAMSDYRREMAEALDVFPMLLDNAYNMVDHEKNAMRAHPLLDKIELNGQATKEMCNLLGMRQLGCATGTIQDFGPDLGLTSMLEGLAGLGP